MNPNTLLQWSYEKNSKKFSHLSKSERDEIAILQKKKYSLRNIARVLRRSVSTISDEVALNCARGAYEPSKAHHKAYVRRKQAKYQGMKIITHPLLWDFVEKKLLEGRSPESISGRINHHEKHLPPISGDSIERFLKSVYGRRIEAERKRIRRQRAWRRRRPRVTQLKNRKFIDKRPDIINRRGRIGDVEADFIISGKSGCGIILTVADRKLRVSFLERILPVSIKNVHRAFQRIKKRYPELRTITTDNDLLFKRHHELEKLLKVTIYFCHPYHSWEKGTIENTNGEIRKSIPKGSDISQYLKKFISRIETKINDRYLECLDFKTPKEALEKCRKQKQRLVAR